MTYDAEKVADQIIKGQNAFFNSNFVVADFKAMKAILTKSLQEAYEQGRCDQSVFKKFMQEVKLKMFRG